MITQITDSANILVNAWKSIVIGSEGEIADIKIDQYMRGFSGDVISRVCFGSNYAKGEEIFSKFRELTTIAASNFFYNWIPGIRYVLYFNTFVSKYMQFN